MRATIWKWIGALTGYPMDTPDEDRASHVPLPTTAPHVANDESPARSSGPSRIAATRGPIILPNRIATPRPSSFTTVGTQAVAVNTSPAEPQSAPEPLSRIRAQRGQRRGRRGRDGAVNSARALVGGRQTQDNPSTFTLKAYGVIPPPNHELDWRMQALDDGTLDKQSPATIMEMLADISPEVSRALWDFLRLANPGYKYDVFKPGTETTDKKAKIAVDAFWERIKERQGTTDVLIGRLFIAAFMRGAFFAELVLDKSGRMGIDIATPDPATVRFKQAEDPVKDGPWLLGQWQSNKFVLLDRETVQYIPVDPFPNSPYGRPMMAPAMFSTLFLIGLLHDLRRVIAQQGYPRIDVVVHLDQIFKRMPEQIRENEQEQDTWARDAITQIETMYRSLQPDDALVHDDSFEVKGPVGTVDSSSLGSVDSIITMLERMAVRSLKTMPLILGITDGVSEANANRQWEIMAAGIKSVQHHCETLLERLLELELQAEGMVANVVFRFSENRSAEELRDQQTLQVKIDNYIKMYNQGWVDQDEAAMAVVEHKPALDEPIQKTPSEGDKTGGSKDDPEPGVKRTMSDDVLRFRTIMEGQGYGRIEEWYAPSKRPDLDADERIVATQKTGRTTTIGGKIYYGWDVFFDRVEVTPKGSDAPLSPPPTEVEVTDDDAGRAVALWDRAMEPDHDGILDATPV